MKSLETIQKVAKFGRTISKIIYTISLVCLIVLIIVGFAFYSIPKNIKLSSKQIAAITGIDTSEEIANDDGKEISFSKEKVAGRLYCQLAITCIVLISEMFIFKKAQHYFEFELKEGTPFTDNGAKKIKELGILVIAVPIVASVISSIIYLILRATLHDVGEFDIDFKISLSFGLFLLFLSAVFRYGASLKNKEEQKN